MRITDGVVETIGDEARKVVAETENRRDVLRCRDALLARRVELNEADQSRAAVSLHRAGADARLTAEHVGEDQRVACRIDFIRDGDLEEVDRGAKTAFADVTL